MIRVLGLMCVLWLGSAQADPIREAERERAQTEKALATLQENVALGSKRIALIETEIERLNRESKALTRQIVEADGTLAQLTEARNATELSISEVNTRLERLIQAYQDELVAYYVTGKTIRPDRSAEGETYGDYLPFVLEARHARVQAIESEQAELRDLLTQQAQNAEAAAEALDTLKQSRAALTRKTEDQQQLLASINRDLSTQQSRRRALSDDLAGLEKRIAALQIDTSDASLAPLKGRLNWPVEGRVIRRFGQTRDDGFGDWQGMVISAIDNSDVRAVQSGKVAYAGYLLGYGLVVVIAHNDGHATIYGHNRELLVQTGDTVGARQAIAITGNTGSLEVAGVYFGLTRNGKPINPTPWLN